MWAALPPCVVPGATPATRPTPGIYLNTVPGAKGGCLTTGDTLNVTISLSQIHHMAMGPRLPDTSKPRHPLAGGGVGDPRPVDPNASGPHRALLQVTMKPTAKLLTTLAEQKPFIVEGLTDDVITLAAHTLEAVTDTCDDAVEHPPERKDRVQEREHTLTPELLDHLVQFTSPPQQHIQNVVMKVTEWTVLNRLPDTPTMTLTCYQHTWWDAQWAGTGTPASVQAFTPEPQTAIPRALADGFRHSANHTYHSLAH